jgi:hypothetical protein
MLITAVKIFSSVGPCSANYSCKKFYSIGQSSDKFLKTLEADLNKQLKHLSNKIFLGTFFVYDFTSNLLTENFFEKLVSVILVSFEINNRIVSRLI